MNSLQRLLNVMCLAALFWVSGCSDPTAPEKGLVYVKPDQSEGARLSKSTAAHCGVWLFRYGCSYFGQSPRWELSWRLTEGDKVLESVAVVEQCCGGKWNSTVTCDANGRGWHYFPAAASISSLGIKEGKSSFRLVVEGAHTTQLHVISLDGALAKPVLGDGGSLAVTPGKELILDSGRFLRATADSENASSAPAYGLGPELQLVLRLDNPTEIGVPDVSVKRLRRREKGSGVELNDAGP